MTTTHVYCGPCGREHFRGESCGPEIEQPRSREVTLSVHSLIQIRRALHRERARWRRIRRATRAMQRAMARDIALAAKPGCQPLLKRLEKDPRFVDRQIETLDLALREIE